jgi:hypothetical protein
MRRRRDDPLARQAILTIAGCRIAIGIGILAAPQPTLKALGFADPSAQALVLARTAGSRDVLIGALTLASRGERRLRTVGLAAAAIDVADTVSFGLAARQPDLRAAGVGGALAGAAAAGTAAWAWRRLGA